MTLARRGATGADDDSLLEALGDPIVVDAALTEGGWFARFIEDRGRLLPDDEALLAHSWLPVVIWHEYGHAIEFDQVVGGVTGALGEGFGDYWAATMSQPVNAGWYPACVAEWNSAGLATPRPCLRRVDRDLTVLDRTGEAHFDGQIWSRALWDINQALGRDAANTLILEAQFAYAPTSSLDRPAGPQRWAGAGRRHLRLRGGRRHRDE